MLLKVININPSNIIVIDKHNKNNEIKMFTSVGVKFIKINITINTFKNVLKNIKKNDIIIDCAYNISTDDMIILCQEIGCHFINSCIGNWNYEEELCPIKYSLYYRNKELHKLNNSFIKKNFNAIISMGCNPGNVSIWMKYGLEKINEKYKYICLTHADLAMRLGVQVIHISEKDTQRTNDEKAINEYCNTWSSDGNGFYNELLGGVEASWGTHEKILPLDTVLFKDNFILLNRMGIYTMAQSVVPIYGRYIGNVISHDEANTIGDYLQVIKNNKLIYKPSVYYVYHPCNSARMSVEELKERALTYQDNWRLLTYEIINGRDILGLTYFLENKEVYWIGSILSVTEARLLFDNKFDEWINATNVQVMAGYLSGILHIIDLIQENKNNGIMFPEDLPYDKIMKLSKPFLGDFIFTKINDFKLLKYTKNFKDKDTYTNEWLFDNFLV
jgi:homospermidine synthase